MALVKVTMWAFRCLRCEHVWLPRVQQVPDGRKPPEVEEEPRVCPKCKSPYWSRPRRSESK